MANLWKVDTHGYEWGSGVEIDRITNFAQMEEDIKDKKQIRLLCQRRDVQGSHEYDIDDHINLYKIFANITPTEEGILEFANRYGLIRGTTGLTAHIEGHGRLVEYAEPLSSWTNHIQAMHDTIEIWEAAAYHRPDILRQRIKWSDEGTWSVDAAWMPPRRLQGSSRIGYQMGSSSGNLWEIYSTFKQGELVRPALAYVIETVNNRLNEMCHAALSWDRKYWDRDEERPLMLMTFKPDSLLGAMWFQFAQAITAHNRKTSLTKICIECGKPFTAKSRAKLVCSDACDKRRDRRKAKER